MRTNLLHGEWTVDAIAEVLRSTSRRPLLPPLDSEEWRQVGSNALLASFIAKLRPRAAKEMDLPLPPLTEELYAITPRTGSRMEFESVYFERRRMMGRAAIALLLSEPQDADRAGLERSVIAKITAILAEPAWALPAHVRTPTGIDPLRIDLFQAETANTMAELIDLFGAILPAELVAGTRERLRRDIFENYRNRWQEMEWPTAGMNWNAVCHQGVIGSALSQVEDPIYLAEMLMLARGFLPHFLAGFTADGGSSEGPAYWDYGFGWFIALNDQLEKRTGGKLSLVEGDAHVRAIARFGPRMQLANQKFVNFSDGPAEGILRPSTLRYLGERLNEPFALQLSRESYRHLTEAGVDLDAHRCDTFFLSRLLLRWPTELDAAPGAEVLEDSFFPDMGVLVARGRDGRGHRWEVAAKGGHNHEHHNHNDCGSYLINIDGQRIIVEIGAPEYVNDYFGARRYEFLAARSLGHSVPVINGVEQAPGKPFQSRILRQVFGGNRTELEIDLTACYPSEAACESYVRTVQFNKSEGRVSVADVFALKEARSLENAVITSNPVLLRHDSVVIQSGPLQLALRPKTGTVLDRVERQPYAAHRTGDPAFVHRIVWKPAHLAQAVRLEYDIELV